MSRKILRFLLLFVFLLTMPLMAFAQYFRNLNVADGLPNSVGKCFAQDGQGFIWVGTFNGLARYDGMRFTTYRHVEGDKASLANSHVESLCYDGNNGLWIGVNGGIDYMSLESKKFSHCLYIEKKGGKPQPMIPIYVWQIIRSGNYLWAVNVAGQLLYKSADKSLVWQQFCIKGHKVMAVAPYDDKHLLVLLDNKLLLLDNHSLAWKAQCTVASTGDYIGNLYYSRNQRLIFVGMGYGKPTFAFSLDSNPQSHAYSLKGVNMPLPYHVKGVVDFYDMTLFATDGQGLKAMRNHVWLSDWHPRYGEIAGHAIHALFVDKDHTLWTGTYREGICMYSARFDNFSSLEWANRQLDNNVVSAVSADVRKIYVGTDGGGLYVYDATGKAPSILTASNSALTGNNIVSLHDDGMYLWIGIYGGAFVV